MEYLNLISGAAMSLSFIFGGILYIWARDEIEDFFEFLTFKNNKLISFVLAILSGAIFVIILKTNFKEVASLILFIVLFILSSIIYKNDTKQETINNSILSAILFFISFTLIFLITQLK